MSSQPSKSRVYKETTFQQLRSFHETARLGSFTAAAASLGMAKPTVWQQVRALEREFGERFLEPDGRGVRLTEGGQLLADMIAPLVTGTATLERRYQEARSHIAPRLVIAATPRIVLEDLPECLIEFRRRHPDVTLTVKDLRDNDILDCVEVGELDVGLLHERRPNFIRARRSVEYEPAYLVDIALITPLGHPLARRRHVRPSDLKGFPLVNGLPDGIPDLCTMAILEKAGVFPSEPQVVQAGSAMTVRHFVKLGFGIGLVFVPKRTEFHADLHVRVMNRYFAPAVIYQVRRKGAPPTPAAVAFMNIVKDCLKVGPNKRK